MATSMSGTDRSSAPAVSVVMPIYNAEPYLRESLGSALSQTFGDLEVVCVDDGSTDGSLAIMREHAARDPRVVIDEGPNGGYGRAMNRGIARARGRWVAILEPDDYLLPTMLATLVPVAEADDLDLVRADFNRFTTAEDGSRELVRQSICHGRTELYGRVLDPQGDPDLLNVRMQSWTGLTRTSFLRAHDVRLHETPGARFQDNGLWLQCYLWAERVEYVREPFYCHRDDTPGSSTNRADLAMAMLDEWAWMREVLDAHPERARALLPTFQYRKYQNCMFAFTRLADELQLAYAERLGSELAAAREAGELELGMFSAYEREQIALLTSDAEAWVGAYRAERARRERAAARGLGFEPPDDALGRLVYYVRAEGVGAACGHVWSALRRTLGRAARRG